VNTTRPVPWILSIASGFWALVHVAHPKILPVVNVRRVGKAGQVGEILFRRPQSFGRRAFLSAIGSRALEGLLVGPQVEF
jgi:hypothetical protein